MMSTCKCSEASAKQKWQFRGMLLEKKGLLFSYKPSQLDGIIFGVNMTTLNKIKIMEIARGKNLNFYQAL